MKIGVLTSSRADYSIYRPLLQEIQKDDFFELSLLVFGSHVSKEHGYTLDQIKEDGFRISFISRNLISGDTPQDIALAMGNTTCEFSEVWGKEKYDLVFALGDRYEMFAAVASTVPFVINIAHIHGGETTLGAIDDSFRHCITAMSNYHFTVTEQYRKRVTELKHSDNHVYNVGSLSYDNIEKLKLLSVDEFREKFKIDLSVPSILITFHPETVSFEKNEHYVSELINALREIKGYQYIITMPNADTMGNMIRKRLDQFISETPHASGIETFGTVGYLSCMKHCSFMLGNTSSGFAEAAFFPKYCINLGKRQSGRIITENIRNCNIEKQEIMNAVTEFKTVQLPGSIEIYGKGNTAQRIVQILKGAYGKL